MTCGADLGLSVCSGQRGDPAPGLRRLLRGRAQRDNLERDLAQRDPGPVLP